MVVGLGALKEKLITTREVSFVLGISEQDVISLANAGVLKHFKLGGEFLRFKLEDVLKAKKSIKQRNYSQEGKHKIISNIKDFFYFNDFYIVCTAVIIILLWVVFMV